MSGGLPRLGVVTVTYNASGHVAPFLKCCQAQDHDNFELLVIDNDSQDSTAALVSEFQDPNLTLIKNSENIGYAAACNQAVAHFQRHNVAEILFINNDTEFGPELFRALAIERLAFGADGVVPRIVLANDTRLNWYAGGRFVFWKAFQAEMMGENKPNDPQDTVSRYTPVAPGCCFMLTTAAIEKIGHFDETFFVYFEDTDYCLRMAYEDRRLLYAPTITLIHKVSTSTGGPVSRFSVRFYNRNQSYILRKHFAIPVIALQLPLILAKAVIRLLRRRDDISLFLLRLRSTWEGLRLPLPAQRWSHYRVPRLPTAPQAGQPPRQRLL